MGRRRFLDVILGGGITALLVGIVYPVFRFIIPPEQPEADASRVVAAKTSELPPNSSKIFKFGKDPAILVHTKSGDYRAFAAICTHLDCTVQYRDDLEHIWCACHNGHYDLNGNNISGPPPSPLAQYEVTVRGEDIIVSKA
ncbi:MAG: Rieske 2Fe-2S domain-containing protein [candidate division Zixibacteria bacterium]|nr:Rieske 2Fe-2S domain-containing protein [candidate division Zixibacteria bacterium]